MASVDPSLVSPRRGSGAVDLRSLVVEGGSGDHKLGRTGPLLERAEAEAPAGSASLARASVAAAPSSKPRASASSRCARDGSTAPPVDGRILPGIARKRALEAAATAGRRRGTARPRCQPRTTCFSCRRGLPDRLGARGRAGPPRSTGTGVRRARGQRADRGGPAPTLAGLSSRNRRRCDRRARRSRAGARPGRRLHPGGNGLPVKRRGRAAARRGPWRQPARHPAARRACWRPPGRLADHRRRRLRRACGDQRLVDRSSSSPSSGGRAASGRNQSCVLSRSNPPSSPESRGSKPTGLPQALPKCPRRNPRDFFQPPGDRRARAVARDSGEALPDDPLPRLLQREDERPRRAPSPRSRPPCRPSSRWRSRGSGSSGRASPESRATARARRSPGPGRSLVGFAWRGKLFEDPRGGRFGLPPLPDLDSGDDREFRARQHAGLVCCPRALHPAAAERAGGAYRRGSGHRTGFRGRCDDDRRRRSRRGRVRRGVRRELAERASTAALGAQRNACPPWGGCGMPAGRLWHRGRQPAWLARERADRIVAATARAGPASHSGVIDQRRRRPVAIRVADLAATGQLHPIQRPDRLDATYRAG